MKKSIVLLALFASSLIAENHIIFLISPPRSLSTAFLRMMYARGDFTVLNEPFIAYYDQKYHPKFAEENYLKAPQSYTQMTNTILEKAKTKNVFIKEMCCAALELFKHDQRLLHDKRTKFVLLARNPHHATISLYKKGNKSMVDILNKILAYNKLYQLCKNISRAKKPHLILTEDLYNNPTLCIKKFCKATQIPFLPESLSWPQLGNSFDAKKEWHDTKKDKSIYIWHSDAIQSTGFGQPTKYDVNAEGNPTFNEITNVEDREKCKQAYHNQLKYYQMLLQEQ